MGRYACSIMVIMAYVCMYIYSLSTCTYRVDDGYGSEAGAPDDADKPEDDALEFEHWRVSSTSA